MNSIETADHIGLENMVNLQGPLNKILPIFDPKTIQHSDEIFTASKVDGSLKNKTFSTADSVIYTIEEDGPIFYLGRLDTNIIFKNIMATMATRPFFPLLNFNPPEQDVAEAIKSKYTLRIRLHDLHLSRYNFETSDFNVIQGTMEGESIIAFVERVFGDLGELTLTSHSGPIIHVLAPEYVYSRIDKKRRALVTLCSISINEPYPFFDATNSYFNSKYFLRGVIPDEQILRAIKILANSPVEKIVGSITPGDVAIIMEKLVVYHQANYQPKVEK